MAIRVLLADDHPIFRAGLRSVLMTQPDVEDLAEAEDGFGAVQAAQVQQLDVAVVDIAMPGMNGVEATRRIRAEAPRVKVLCLSMHSDSRFVQAALRSGAHGYLLKDCALLELVTAIRSVIAGQIYVSPGLGDAVLAGYRAEGHECSFLSLLTSRQREILQLLAEGHSTAAVASRLCVSVKTVGTHREHLMQKLGTRSVAGLTKFAIREGLISAQE
jgi:DNA-binding NarL/FixJ family response regulator